MAAVLHEARPGEQAAMRLEHDLLGDRSRGRHRLDRPEHRLDVPEYLHCGDVARVLSELAGQCFGVGERDCRRVEPDECRLCFRDIGRDIPVEHEPPTDKGVGDVDCVLTGAAITACQAASITLPAPYFQLCHADFLILGYSINLNIGRRSSRFGGEQPHPRA